MNDATLAVQVSTWVNDRCWWHWSSVAVNNWSCYRSSAVAAVARCCCTSAVADDCVTAVALSLEQLGKQSTALLGSTAAVASVGTRVTSRDFTAASWSCTATAVAS